jgi:hypothetical protein
VDALLKLLATVVCLGALAYVAHAFRAGRIVIKGVAYPIDRPVAFAFSAALIATFSLMLLGFLFAYDYMKSDVQWGALVLFGGMAMAARVLLLLGMLFVASLVLQSRISRSADRGAGSR